MTGPAIWRGGVNEFKPGSINNTWLDTECGINRVFIRSTFKPGEVTVKARRDGLESASATVEAKLVEIVGGLIPIDQ